MAKPVYISDEGLIVAVIFGIAFLFFFVIVLNADLTPLTNKNAIESFSQKVTFIQMTPNENVTYNNKPLVSGEKLEVNSLSNIRVSTNFGDIEFRIRNPNVSKIFLYNHQILTDLDVNPKTRFENDSPYEILCVIDNYECLINRFSVEYIFTTRNSKITVYYANPPNIYFNCLAEKTLNFVANRIVYTSNDLYAFD